MRDLLHELTTALESRRPCVYCALVETRGSTPQKAGAAMLVYPDGGQCGTLGGGCVEAEVRQRALRGLTAGSTTAEVFTFNLDDDYGWDDGLICGGRLMVLAHPIADFGSQIAVYYRRYRDLIDVGAGCVEAVAITEAAGLPIGNRFLFDAKRALVATIGEALTDDVRKNLPDLASRPRPSVKSGVAYLPTLPRVRLLIVGGGHVGQAVAKLAAEVDFDVWVLDDREKYSNPERFPQAEKCLVGDIGQTLKQLIAENAVTPSTFALITTRGHNHDEEALHHLAPTPAAYVGMIGSKRKIRLIFDDLIHCGISDDVLKRVHAPLGLEIGSRTVPEIAVSIIAELIACRNLGHTPRSLSPSRPGFAGEGSHEVGEAGGGEGGDCQRAAANPLTPSPLPRLCGGEGARRKAARQTMIALIPAAGHSTRMGRPKLSLPLAGRTVLECVVQTLKSAGVAEVVVVIGTHVAELVPLAERAGAHALLLPAPTPDMRTTVERGLDWIEQTFQPKPEDDWLLVPADHPALDAAAVRHLIAEYQKQSRCSIAIPTFAGKRGHPAVIAWKHVAGIRALPMDVGLNAYLRQHAGETLEAPVDSDGVLIDLDTQEEYERLVGPL